MDTLRPPDALIMGLDGIAVSNGSACTAASVDLSHVLLAMGLDEAEVFSCLRFSLGRFSEATEVPLVNQLMGAVIQQLRAYATA